jgi:5-dehydro-2-deoxygluconokinase
METFDLIAIGRSSIDLYSNDIGAPFEEITSFAAYVGGCPTNICVGASRLGLRTALLTAVGEDKVGDFILHYLEKERVETRYIPRKAGFRTSAVLLGIQPPDHFPLTFYRDHCADNEITISDVLTSPLRNCRTLLINGTALAHDPSRSATLYAAETARSAGAKVFLDLDFRPDQWLDLRAFGVAIRSALPFVDVILGTDDEINAAMLEDRRQIQINDSQVSDARVSGNVEEAIAGLLALGPQVLLQKRGAQGSRIHRSGQPSEDAAGFPVNVQNILGAGDAFAAGVIYAYLQGWEWLAAARFGNACGAIVVTRHGSSNATPTLKEVQDFLAAFSDSSHQ